MTFSWRLCRCLCQSFCRQFWWRHQKFCFHNFSTAEAVRLSALSNSKVWINLWTVPWILLKSISVNAQERFYIKLGGFSRFDNYKWRTYFLAPIICSVRSLSCLIKNFSCHLGLNLGKLRCSWPLKCLPYLLTSLNSHMWHNKTESIR